jgi:hypothetical protein
MQSGRQCYFKVIFPDGLVVPPAVILLRRLDRSTGRNGEIREVVIDIVVGNAYLGGRTGPENDGAICHR